MSSMMMDLQDPARLPDPTEQVSVVQTHISMVFVADHFVYKVKKPVNFGFLDFSTVEKRAYYCRQEVVLNRRLTKDIYLGVLPVTFDGDEYRLGKGPGEVVDYAVKMRRIPQEKLMKSVFLRGELKPTHLDEIARVLSDFHRKAARGPRIEQYGEPEKFRVNTDENFRQVEKYQEVTISAQGFEDLKHWTSHFYRKNERLFHWRIRQARIRDCHGDLHMEHICLIEGLPIFDCIEFNDRFRYSDTLADIAFLLMDLDYHGGEKEATALWDGYKEAAGERQVEALLTFYKVYRAFVRGKVISFQLDDPEIGEQKKEEAVRKAERYFDLAFSYIQ